MKHTLSALFLFIANIVLALRPACVVAANVFAWAGKSRERGVKQPLAEGFYVCAKMQYNENEFIKLGVFGTLNYQPI